MSQFNKHYSRRSPSRHGQSRIRNNTFKIKKIKIKINIIKIKTKDEEVLINVNEFLAKYVKTNFLKIGKNSSISFTPNNSKSNEIGSSSYSMLLLVCRVYSVSPTISFLVIS